MNRKTITLLFAVLLTITRAGAAQVACNDPETIADCWTKIYKGTDVVAVAASAAKSDLEKKTTGVDSFASDLSSTIKNFLPLFDGLVESQTLSDDGTALTLNLNLPFLSFGNGRNFQTQAIFRKPVLFEGLKTAFPESVRAARTEALDKKLDNTDDASLVLSYNMATARTGRSFEQYRNLHSALFQAIVEKVPDGSGIILLALGQLAQDNPDIFPPNSGDMKFESIKDPGLRELAKSLVERSASAASEHRTALEERANAQGLDLFADLVNNQPQFYVSVAQRSRRDLVGPDELSGKLTYEKGFLNINKLRRQLGESCLASASSGAAAPDCLTTYSKWIKENRQRIKAGERISLAVEYEKEEAYSFQAPTDHVDVQLPTSHKLMATFSYGRYLMFTTENQNTRLDISAKYEDFSKDASRRDRGTGSITITRKISESMSLPIGLVYANHGQFLGEVDKKLSVHFGLKFNLFTQTN